MTQISAEDRQARIQQAVDLYIDLQSRERSVSIDQFAAQRTELLPELKVELEKVERIHGAWKEAREPLSDSPPTVSLEPAQGESSPTAGLHIRCAHCHTPVDLHEDTPLSHITCSRCGGTFSIVEVDERFQPGAMLGHFRLVEQLGSGGFGTVWRADDTDLERSVAVKIPLRGQVEPQQVEQFLREARTAAQLAHPGIVSVHEVGREGDTVYIVSQLVEGTTLDQWQRKGRPARPRRAAEMCRRIALALHYAHERGVVHRDLKPQNILVDAAEEPHLMDFGLARRAHGETTVTRDGNVLGTPAYMSPEQARGKSHHVDARTDIYSLGVILFQLLTGRLPFDGDTSRLLYQVIHSEPPRPRSLSASIPKDLETICLKCLEKEPERRYASADEVASDLDRYLARQPILARPVSRVERAWRWCRRNPGYATLTTAVLVLVTTLGLVGMRPSLVSDPVVDSLAVVLRAAEDDQPPSLRAILSRSLISRLLEFSNLRIVPRARVLIYEDMLDTEPGELADKLGVDGVLVGEVDDHGDTFRLRIRLVTQDDRLLWEHVYTEQPIDRWPGVEQGILRAVVPATAVELTGEEQTKIRVNSNISAAAYKAYFDGKRSSFQNTERSLVQAEKEFLKAIELEPGFAEAYAGLAEVYLSLANLYRRPTDYYHKARSSVETALSMDASLIDAIVAEGLLEYLCNWNWDAARDALDRALEFDPTLIERNYCYLHMLDALGRPDEAVRLVETALLGQPMSELLHVERACSLYYAHRFEESREAIQGVLDSLASPNPAYLWHLARAYNQLQQYDRAVGACEAAFGLGDQWSGLYAERAYAYAMQGKVKEALEVIDTLNQMARGQYIDPYEYAMIYAGLSEQADRSSQPYRDFVNVTLSKLREAREVKSAWLPSLNTDPKFDHLRDEAEFRQLLEDIGFHAWTRAAKTASPPAP